MKANFLSVGSIRTSDVGRHGPLPEKRRKLQDWVRSRIGTGAFRPGAILPNRRWFCEKFKLAEHSVQRAFAELVDEGLLVAVPRHGTRVADSLPFAGRFLMLLSVSRRDAGGSHFSPSLRAAASRVAVLRHVEFEFRELDNADRGSLEYAETLSEIRRQRFAGVIAQSVTESEHGLDTVTNVDCVPIAFFGVKSEFTQGRMAIPFDIYGRDWELRLMDRHFAGLYKRGCRSVAVFKPFFAASGGQAALSKIAAKYGMSIVRNGYHTFDMHYWDSAQFGRWVDLFLASDAGRSADSVILGDDNMLMHFGERYRRQFGSGADGRYRISCHCNFPIVPECDLPVEFHGPDLVGAISSFVDYAADCRAGVNRPRVPAIDAV